MLELSAAQIGTWVATFMLPLFRVAAVLMTMPIFSTRMLPARIRLYASVAITVAIVPALPPMPEFEVLSVRGVLLCAEQIIIGAVFGFSMQMLFQAFVIAGQIVAIQMGMAMASMIDPANGVNVAVVGQFLTMLVSVLFLLMNGHLVVLEVLAESFTTLPVGNALVVQHFWEIAGRLGWVLGAGLIMILPVIAALLVINIAFGVMTRAAPQLNIFSIGFPLTVVVGLVIFWIGLADVLSHYQQLSSEALQWLRQLARAP